MIDIDGSMMEGGGQILRTAVAYSTLLGEPVRVRKIRTGRSQPGLKPQHMKTLEAASKISGAEVKGLAPRSKEITYKPGRPHGGSYIFDIGTAGSISLLLQCLAPITAFADSPVKLRLIGGTDVQWSPPVAILDHVIWEAYRKMGFQGNLQVQRHGFYPKGGGVVEAEFQPVKKLSGLHVTRQGQVHVEGISMCGRLPRHVAERQAKSAGKVLSDAGYVSDIEVAELRGRKSTFSPGSSISLWTRQGNGLFIGGSALGVRGKPAERVGSDAAKQIIRELDSRCCVDGYTTDNLILWASIAEGVTRFTTSVVSQHTLTAIKLAEIFTDSKILVSEGGYGCSVISIEGVGLSAPR